MFLLLFFPLTLPFALETVAVHLFRVTVESMRTLCDVKAVNLAHTLLILSVSMNLIFKMFTGLAKAVDFFTS